MSINYSPDSLSIAYRPLQYSTTKTRAKATPIVFAEVSVVELSTSDIIATNVYPFAISNNATNPTTESDFNFVFDISRIVQDYFIANTSVLPTPFVAASNSGAVPAGVDVIRNFGIVAAYYIKSSGLINLWTSNNDFGSSVTCLNATAQHTEDFALTDYVATSTATNYIYSATKNRGTIYTCRNKPVYISQITDGTIVPADLAYIAYKNGQPVGGGLIPSTTTTVNANVYTKDVGSASLDNNAYLTLSDASLTALDPNTPLGFSDIGFADNDYDCISFWWGVGTLNGEVYEFSATGSGLVSSFDAATTAIKVDYTGCCNDRTMNLYWINEFGTVDQYMFDSIKLGKLKASGKVAKSALTYAGGTATPHNVNQGGSFKFSPTGSESFELKSKPLTAEELEYIKYLTLSPYTFAYIDGNFVPVRIEAGDYQISQQKGKQVLEVTAVLSNDLVIHRR